MSELPVQPIQSEPVSKTNKIRRLVLAHVPEVQLTTETPLSKMVSQRISLPVLSLSHSQTPTTSSIELSLAATGCMLYHPASFYIMSQEQQDHPDASPLCYWVPKTSEDPTALDMSGLQQRLPSTTMLSEMSNDMVEE